MYTEERLFTYLQQFERDFAKSKANLIDASEGGALKRGTVIMPLAEAIDKYCTASLPSTPEPTPPPRWDLLETCVSSLRTRRDEAGRIEAIGLKTLPLLQEIADHIDDQPRVNRAITRIDQFRAEMNELGRTYDLVMQLSQQTELRRFERDRKLAAEKLDGLDRQKRQVLRDIENAKAVIEAARDFQKMMDEVADHWQTKAVRQKEAA
jgi:hypothetical protein